MTTSHASGLPVATARGTDPVTAQVGRDLAEKVGSESGWMAPPSESGGLVFQKLWSSPVVSLVSSDAPVPVSRGTAGTTAHENFKNSHPESGYSRDTDDKHPTDVIVGLALWTRTKGMCCWLLFDDADDCSSEASCTTTDAEDAAGPPLWHSEKVSGRILQLLKLGLERKNSHLTGGAVSLIGNLLACPACHTCFHHTIRELTELLHAVPMEFAGNTLLGRMTARALYYYYERADAQARAEALHAHSPHAHSPLSRPPLVCTTGLARR